MSIDGTGTKRRLALVLVISAALLLIGTGQRMFVTNDEARFPMLARDILAGGDWWRPRLNGIPHLNKPPLHAWLIALTAWPTQTVTQWNAALPSIAAALVVIMLTYWIAARLFDVHVALMAASIVVTTAGIFTLARVPMPDMTLCAVFTAAIAAFVGAEFAGHQHGLLVFYALVACGFWVKGPAVFLAIAVVVVYQLATYGHAGWRGLRSWSGLFGLVLFPLPWWLLGISAGATSFGREIVINDFLLWYLPLGKWSWRHLTDPVVQALTILLPWSIVLPFALHWATHRGDSEFRRRVLLLVIWMAVVFALVAIGQEQRWRYYLPLCPPAALLIAAWASQLRFGRRLGWVIPGAVGVALLFAVGYGPVIARRNAATDFRHTIDLMRDTPGALYAVDVPELVMAFYLGRPVNPLPNYQRFESLLRAGQHGYLIVADRAVPSTGAIGLKRMGGGVIDKRPFSVFAPN